MLTAFVRAFRTPDLRKKLLFTIFIIAMFRLGASLPTPGISEKAVESCLNLVKTSNTSLFQLVNLFSGGALYRLSVFALGIMPYITASIILQLLAVVIPRLETLRQEGQAGQAKITQYTRYLTCRPGHPAVDRDRRAGQVGHPVRRQRHHDVLEPDPEPGRCSPSPRW